jgi:hypothetical protein
VRNGLVTTETKGLAKQTKFILMGIFCYEDMAQDEIMRDEDMELELLLRRFSRCPWLVELVA